MKKIYFLILMNAALFISLTGEAQIPNGANDPNGIPSDLPFSAQIYGTGSTPQFYAYVSNNIVMIRWKPDNEENIDRYVVEKGTDSSYFIPFHQVVAMGGVENQDAYEDADSYPASQENFYRLRTITKGGTSFYSSIITVDMAGSTNRSIKPSVINKGSTLHFDSYYQQPVIILFFNTEGIRTGSYMVNSSYFDISTANWGKGLYFYRVSDASHPLIDAGKILVL